MACSNCNDRNINLQGFSALFQRCNPCSTTTTGCGNDCASSDTRQIIYSGPNLSCSTVVTGDCLEDIITKIDSKLCAVLGDYSTYNKYCLGILNTEKAFVEAISQFVCNLQTSFTTFTTVTFPAYQTTVDTRFDAIEVPGITCTSASVVPTDTLQQVLNKYCTKFVSIDTLLNISGADWDQCYSVSPIPTTPTEAFDVLIDQICTLKAQVEAGGSLPTFNNVGSCLAVPVTATDSLVDTVNKIKTRLCLTGTIDTTTLTWGCVTQPSGAQNLQDTLQNILTRVTTIAQSLPTTWSADFAVTNVDNGNLCLGKSIDLATPSAQDRFVAATATDLSPGTLQDKVTAGTNITLDFLSTPGEMIINAAAGSTDTFQVKSDIVDPSPAFLDTKIITGGLNNGIQVVPNLNPLTHKIELDVSVDLVTLFLNLIDTISIDENVKNAFCAAVASCPSPCSAPSNIEVTYSNTTSSTTTSSTTV